MKNVMSQKAQAGVFNLMRAHECEELVFKYDLKTDLRFVMVAHNRQNSAKVNGGTRMLSYRSEMEGLEDGILLAKAMTKKNLLYSLPWGGGKGIVFGDPKAPKTRKKLHKLGEFIESFGGGFQTTFDMGLSAADAQVIAEKTGYIDSLDPRRTKGALGPCGIGAGVGVIAAIKVALKEVFGDASLAGRTIVVQGLGIVGGTVVEKALQEGALVLGSDIDPTRAQQYKRRFHIQTVPPSRARFLACDVFSPCATGGVIRKADVAKLQCRIIAGGANNQLLKEPLAKALHRRGILYLPDYAVNAGGMIESQCEYEKKNVSQAREEVRQSITKMITLILRRSKRTRITPLEAADLEVSRLLRRAQRARRT